MAVRAFPELDRARQVVHPPEGLTKSIERFR
jgi:hypothetical protein